MYLLLLHNQVDVLLIFERFKQLDDIWVILRDTTDDGVAKIIMRTSR